ncbi:MAG: hypothetical protein HQL34_01240 [Alphaproteobacteria bacterium]|nr:hypothetical protein [Alphaproteobacteria bacterium]
MSALAGASVLIVAGFPGAEGKEALGLGDLVRVLAMLPHFGARRVGWCSPPHLRPLIADCREVTEVVPPERLAQAHEGYDVTLNLDRRSLPFAGVVGIDELIAGNGPLKRATFDLPVLIGRRFGAEVPERFSPARSEGNRDIDVGLNWRVPDAWAIKALPPPLWREIAGLLGVSLTVDWQPDNDDLAAYVAWIKRCRLLISSVGLGCHLAMYHGAALIVLAGPTDFAEAHGYEPGTVLWPDSPCVHRPCFAAAGVDGCGGCMHAHVPTTVAAAARTLLQQGRG